MKFSNLTCCFLFTFALSPVLTSCISVGIPATQIVSSQTLKYTDPKPPFIKAGLKGLEASWKSNQTSNIITLQSNCSSDTESTLDSMEADAKSAFDQAVQINTREYLFLERKAKRSLIKGDIDGVGLMMDILVFKKDGCSYTIAFSGRKLDSESELFETFVNGLRIP